MSLTYYSATWRASKLKNDKPKNLNASQLGTAYLAAVTLFFSGRKSWTEFPPLVILELERERENSILFVYFLTAVPYAFRAHTIFASHTKWIRERDRIPDSNVSVCHFTVDLMRLSSRDIISTIVRRFTSDSRTNKFIRIGGGVCVSHLDTHSRMAPSQFNRFQGVGVVCGIQ